MSDEERAVQLRYVVWLQFITSLLLAVMCAGVFALFLMVVFIPRTVSDDVRRIEEQMGEMLKVKPAEVMLEVEKNRIVLERLESQMLLEPQPDPAVESE